MFKSPKLLKYQQKVEKLDNFSEFYSYNLSVKLLQVLQFSDFFFKQWKILQYSYVI